MNTPPPRHAPLSRPLFPRSSEKTREYTKEAISSDTLTLPVAPTLEDTDSWKEALHHHMASYNSEAEALPPRQYVERQTSLARLALASGTGEDVAAFDTPVKRPRIRLEGKALQALALLLAVILAGVWIYLGVNGKKIREKSDNAPTPQVSIAQNAPAQKRQDSATDIVVYISGAVAQPGVYTLPAGSRVNNLVEAARGLTHDAQSAAINLASALNDGEHIHIPAQGEDVPVTDNADTSAADGAGSGKININTASATQLEQLPGIGPSLSQTIIAWREDNGRFESPEDLLEVSGIGQAKYAKLKNLVTVG